MPIKAMRNSTTNSLKRKVSLLHKSNANGPNGAKTKSKSHQWSWTSRTMLLLSRCKSVSAKSCNEFSKINKSARQDSNLSQKSGKHRRLFNNRARLLPKRRRSNLRDHCHRGLLNVGSKFRLNRLISKAEVQQRGLQLSPKRRR